MKNSIVFGSVVMIGGSGVLTWYSARNFDVRKQLHGSINIFSRIE